MQRDAAWKDVAFKAAHKLGNPIDAIDTYLQGLKRRLQKDLPEGLNKEQQYLKVDFEANGYGVPFENKEKIFAPFYTTDPHGTFLKRYFDPKVFSVIDKNPELLDIQNRTLTIVFWDIRNFSSLCEILKAHPTLIAGFLREYFNAASRIIFKYHGVLDKFIGDGVMALFEALNGKDKEGHQDAINAVKAAIEMSECFDQVMKNWMEKWVLYVPQKIDIGLRCGIHTGETLVGNVGTEWRDQYTALGPHVNFAQRIESKATKRQVLISASTKARISDHFELRKIDTINNIKNISGEFEIFEVITFKK